jgi:hypothetical protein
MRVDFLGVAGESGLGAALGFCCVIGFDVDEPVMLPILGF